MKIKIIATTTIMALSFFTHQAHAHKESDGTTKHCSYISSGYISITFSADIPTATMAQKKLNDYIEGVEAVIKKLKLSDLKLDSESFDVYLQPLQREEDSESKEEKMQFKGDVSYKSKSAKSLSIFMDALHKKGDHDWISYSMSKYEECK